MKNYTPCIYINVLLVFFISSLSLSAYDGEKSFVDKDNLLKLLSRTAFPEQSEFPGEDAVILYERRAYEHIVMEFSTHDGLKRVIKLFKKDSPSANLTINLKPNEELLSFNARVILPNGSETVYDKTILNEKAIKNNNGDILYTKLTAKFPKLENNSILEYNYVLKTHDWMLGKYWQIQEQNASKLYAKFIFQGPTEFETKFYLINKASKDTIQTNFKAQFLWSCNPGFTAIDVNPVEKIDNSAKASRPTRTLEWEFYDIPAFTVQPKIPAYSSQIASLKIRFGTNGDWRIHSNFFNNIISSGYEKSSATDGLLKSLINNNMNDSAKISAIAQYVTGFKTSAIPFYSSCYYPSNLEATIDKKSGNSQDKASLVIALLRTAGYKAYPALMLTLDEGAFDPQFCAWNFNKMIVYAENSKNEPIWIDPSESDYIYNRLPWMDNSVPALVALDGTQIDFKVPLLDSKQSKIVADQKINIISSDSATYAVDLKFYGYCDEKLRGMNDESDKKLIVDYINSFIKPSVKSAGMNNFTIDNISKNSEPMKISFHFTGAINRNTKDNSIKLPEDILSISFMTDSLDRDARFYPVMYKYPQTIESNSIITFPEAKYSLQYLPNDAIIRSETMDYNESLLDITKSQITVNKVFEVKAAIITFTDYEKLCQVFDKMDGKKEEKILIKEK